MEAGKIILLYQPLITEESQTMPFSLLALERMIQKETADVVIKDEKFDTDIWVFLQENSERIVLIGVTVMLSYQVIGARNFAQKIKQRYNIPVLFGGVFVTMAPQMVISERFVDLVIFGQGELPFKKLVDEIVSGNMNFNLIKGLGYKTPEGIVINGPDSWVNTFSFPSFNYNAIDVTRYTEFDGKYLKYIGSTGCNCSCNFCLIGNTRGIKHAVNSPEIILKDINYFLQKIPALTRIEFTDANFLLNKGPVIELCNLLLKNKIQIKWMANTNIRSFLEHFTDTDIETLKNAGCYRINFGAESGDPVVLNNLNKNHNPADIVRLCKRLSSHKIGITLLFMFGFPPFPQRDIKLTLKLIMQLFTSFPNIDVTGRVYGHLTENNYFQEAIKCGYIPPKKYQDYENIITHGIILKYIKQWHRNKIKYFGHYYIPVFKKEIPHALNPQLHKIWKIISFLWFPFVKIRFRLKIYQFNFDAALVALLMNGLSQIKGIKNKNLNRIIDEFS